MSILKGGALQAVTDAETFIKNYTGFIGFTRQKVNGCHAQCDVAL